MAFDPEEMRKQRQQRAQQRQAQAKKRRALWIKLAIAAVVLLACGILIFVISRQDQAQPGNPQPSETAASTALPDTVIHFAAAGDLNITDAVVAAGGDAYDYTPAFLDVAHLLADADISAVNFEGSLHGEPYGTEEASAPQTMLQALSRAGVDLVQLANSYSIHHGVSGLSTTIDGVRAAGMEPLGVYADQAAFEAGKGFTIREVQGIRVAFVAFTKGMDGMALPSGSENCVNVLYTDYSSTYQHVDTEGISAILDAAAAADPDITIALLHWGSEFNDTISESQEKIVTLLQEKGVDAIVGTHSHYVQKMVFDPEAGTFVAYSLGDFFGDAARAGSEYSVILDLEITKNNSTGETKITNYSYTPIFTVTGEQMRVVRIRETVAAFESLYIERVSQETYDAMKYALTRIEARTAGE